MGGGDGVGGGGLRVSLVLIFGPKPQLKFEPTEQKVIIAIEKFANKVQIVSIKCLSIIYQIKCISGDQQKGTLFLLVNILDP